MYVGLIQGESGKEVLNIKEGGSCEAISTVDI